MTRIFKYKTNTHIPCYEHNLDRVIENMVQIENDLLSNDDIIKKIEEQIITPQLDKMIDEVISDTKLTQIKIIQ